MLKEVKFPYLYLQINNFLDSYLQRFFLFLWHIFLSCAQTKLNTAFEYTIQNPHNYFEWVLSMFQMTIENYTMGSNCNLQTFVHIEGISLSVISFQQMVMMAVIYYWSKFNFSHFYS